MKAISDFICRFQKLHKTSTEWANVMMNEQDDVEALLKTTKQLTGQKSMQRLPQSFLSIIRSKDANLAERSEVGFFGIIFNE